MLILTARFAELAPNSTRFRLWQYVSLAFTDLTFWIDACSYALSCFVIGHSDGWNKVRRISLRLYPHRRSEKDTSKDWTAREL